MAWYLALGKMNILFYVVFSEIFQVINFFFYTIYCKTFWNRHLTFIILVYQN